MVAERVPERSFRGPGCTAACEIIKAIVPGRFGRSELLLHDPESHEAYGRATASAADVRGTRIVIGPLEIERLTCRAWVDGQSVDLTPREWELLEFLAAQGGRLCRRAEIRRAIWQDWATNSAISVLIVRLRAKLGPGGYLLQNRPGFGFALRADPIVSDRRAGGLLGEGAWSRRWPHCICCGRRSHLHYGHGRCERCRYRTGSRRQHYGPCGAPPVEIGVAP